MFLMSKARIIYVEYDPYIKGMLDANRVIYTVEDNEIIVFVDSAWVEDFVRAQAKNRGVNYRVVTKKLHEAVKFWIELTGKYPVKPKKFNLDVSY
jgi:hypothetical protein